MIYTLGAAKLHNRKHLLKRLVLFADSGRCEGCVRWVGDGEEWRSKRWEGSDRRWCKPEGKAV